MEEFRRLFNFSDHFAVFNFPVVGFYGIPAKSTPAVKGFAVEKQFPALFDFLFG
jgi:hypothetical protein